MHLLITMYCIFMSNGPFKLWFLLGAAIGSFLPDCDIKFSPAGILLPLWAVWKHRTITHSVYAAAFVSSIVYVINRDVGSGILVGYGLHLAADATTRMSLPYALYPYWVKQKPVYRRAR